MSEKTNKNYLQKIIEKNKKGVALVMGLAALYGTLNANKVLSQPRGPAGPEKVYVAKPGDTEWGIAQKAFPGSDPRSHEEMLDSQLPHDLAHANHTVQPGDRFILPSSADIGAPEEIASRG